MVFFQSWLKGQCIGGSLLDTDSTIEHKDENRTEIKYLTNAHESKTSIYSSDNIEIRTLKNKSLALVQ